MISHPSPGLVQAPWHGHHPGPPATGDRFHRRFVGGAACRDACAVGEALPPATAGGSSVTCWWGWGSDCFFGKLGSHKIRHFLEIWVLAQFFFFFLCVFINLWCAPPLREASRKNCHSRLSTDKGVKDLQRNSMAPAFSRMVWVFHSPPSSGYKSPSLMMVDNSFPFILKHTHRNHGFVLGISTFFFGPCNWGV